MWGVVVAAGLGRRFGAEKQFLSLTGKPVHLWAVEATRTVAAGVVLVVPPGREHDPHLALAADRVVAGGKTRSASVRAGLGAVPEDAAIIVVHDAVRPLASEALFRAVVSAVVAGAEGAIPGLDVPDTVKFVEAGVVRSTIERANLVRVQTPQAFRAATLRRAHASETDATDDAAVVEALGARVVVVPGEEGNLKITSPADLALLEWRLAVGSLAQQAP
ncbi:MAG: 2-C-methyl-D-erythritol 4-phosphate cytidylyltransferase [Acidimicrobiales bacterium]